jgi:hypothetical protein
MMKGREMPATAIARARFPVRRMARRSSSRPTKKRKKRSPMFATVSSTVKLDFGNTVFRNFWFLPSADGPSKIPPYNIHIHIKKSKLGSKNIEEREKDQC